jgi:purine-nucleoside phosphorylase
MAHDDAIGQAAAQLRDHLGGGGVDVLVTLGSGLAGVADAFRDAIEVPADSLVGMPRSTVPGHTGMLRLGRLGGATVLGQVGRVHLYEGHSGPDVVRMVDVAAALGAHTFLVTNAAGGLDPSFVPGDVMAITDQLNLTGDSPHTGVLRDGGPVFQDMAHAYDPALRALAHDIAGQQGFELREGVYAGLRGPAFETHAEVQMLRTLGAHAVGMSTVLEVIAARSHGMRVAGLSTITNVHGEGVATSHEEVLEVGRTVSERVSALVLGLLEAVTGSAT